MRNLHAVRIPHLNLLSSPKYPLVNQVGNLNPKGFLSRSCLASSGWYIRKSKPTIYLHCAMVIVTIGFTDIQPPL